MAVRETKAETVAVTGGEAIVRSLLREGVEVVFGIPGAHTVEFYDALFDYPELGHIVVRHEQGASFLADGYARATGKVGVCMLITGPGLTNAATGIAQAYSDSVPLLILSSQNPARYMDQERGLLHDLKHQSGLMESITAYSETVSRVGDMPDAIRRAFHYLRTRRPRPVHLQVPIDVLSNRELVTFAPVGQDDVPPIADPSKLEAIADALIGGERPLLIVGGGAKEASQEVRVLAKRLAIPVVATTNGKGVFPETHPLALGANMRNPVLQDFVANRDVVLAVGTELSGQEFRDWAVPLGRELYQIDIDYTAMNRNYPVKMGVVGDAQRSLAALLAILEERGPGAPARADTHQVARLNADLIGYPEEPENENAAILGTLKKTLADDAILVNDMTMPCYGAGGSYPAEYPRTFLFPRGLGTLGWSVPAAIGAKLGQPDRQVVALVGDGGFLFTSGELATAMKYRVGLPIVLFNNESYGMVERIQLRRFDRAIDCDIVNPDFVDYAHSFGAAAERMQSHEVASRLPDALRRAFDREVPTLIELRGDFGF